jgi:hypothetical protein
MPQITREELEACLKDGLSIRKTGERFGINRNIVFRHVHECMERSTPDADAHDKLKHLAGKLEKKGDFRGAASVYVKIIDTNPNENTEDIYGFLGRIAPRLCDECRTVILSYR